jgi:ankyrin repeat protein
MKFIEYGADVNKLNAEGISPLLFASRGKKKTVVARHLIRNGADVNFRIGDETPLSNAIKSMNFHMIKLLVRHNADASFDFDYALPVVGNYVVKMGKNINNKMKDKFTDLSKFDITFREACFTFEATKFYKGDINQVDDAGSTLLLYAIAANDVEWVKHLLERGIDQTIKDEKGCTAVNIIEIRNNEIYRLLRDSINIPDIKGNTVISKMIDNMVRRSDLWLIEKIKFLISIGAVIKPDYMIKVNELVKAINDISVILNNAVENNAN